MSHALLTGLNIINGQSVEGTHSKWFEVLNPATGAPLGKAVLSDADDVNAAVLAAKEAQPSWANLSAKKRGSLMFDIAHLLSQHKEELIYLMMLETGKAIRTECRPEVEGFPSTFEFFGGLASELKGETIPFDPSMLTMTIRQPLGVVAAILPWNVPLLLLGLKVPPALVAGNTIVLKSAEQSPLITYRAIELMNQILPKGVLNLVSGDGPSTGVPLVAHPDIRKVTFTGSVEAGIHVNVAAAKRLVPTTLELGGKGPMIICEDADLPSVVDGAIAGMRFTRQGQSCSASSRIFVHERLYDAFLKRFLEKINTLKIGDPSDESTDIGSIISKEQLDRVKFYVNEGKKAGLKIHECCKLPVDDKLKNGFWHTPTVFEAPSTNNRLAKEEIFGPVVLIFKWSNFQEALHEANNTSFGLTASIWTQNIKHALNTALQLEAGFVQVNQNIVVKPGLSYGGVKYSGLGKEASLESMLEHFTQKKTILINLT